MALSGTNKPKQGSFINEELLVPKRVVDIILDINQVLNTDCQLSKYLLIAQ